MKYRGEREKKIRKRRRGRGREGEKKEGDGRINNMSVGGWEKEGMERCWNRVGEETE